MAATWTAERFEQGPEGARGTIVRFRGPRGQLSGPSLVRAESGKDKMLKIIYGEHPMLFFDDFDDDDVDSLTDTFVQVARQLTESEAARPLSDVTARRLAAEYLRKRLLRR